MVQCESWDGKGCHRPARWTVEVRRTAHGLRGYVTHDVCGVHLHRFLDAQYADGADLCAICPVVEPSVAPR